MSQILGVDVESASLDKLVSLIDGLGIVVDRGGLNRPRAMDALWKPCRRSLAGPGFLVDEPLEVSRWPRGGRTVPASWNSSMSSWPGASR